AIANALLQGRHAIERQQGAGVALVYRHTRLVEGPGRAGRLRIQQRGAQVPVTILRVCNAVLVQAVTIGAGDDRLLALELVIAVQGESTGRCTGHVDDLDALHRLRPDAIAVSHAYLGLSGGRARPAKPIRCRAVVAESRLDPQRPAVARIVAGHGQRADAATARCDDATVGNAPDPPGSFQPAGRADVHRAAETALDIERAGRHRSRSDMGVVVACQDQ